MSNHHFFGVTGGAWAKASTREEVIRKLARDAGATWIKNAKKQGLGGVYAWTCRVEVSQDTPYAIDNYKPVEVPYGETQQHAITNTRGAWVPYQL